MSRFNDGADRSKKVNEMIDAEKVGCHEIPQENGVVLFVCTVSMGRFTPKEKAYQALKEINGE